MPLVVPPLPQGRTRSGGQDFVDEGRHFRLSVKREHRQPRRTRAGQVESDDGRRVERVGKALRQTQPGEGACSAPVTFTVCVAFASKSTPT